MLLSFQERIYEKVGDSDMVPTSFKIRRNFPYAKSGKRDIERLKSETDGFIEPGSFKPRGMVKKLKP